MKEFQPGAYFNEEAPKQGKRGFIRGMIAGAVGLYVGNKYLKKEQEINNFYKQFEGKEGSYEVASEAALLLISEMKMSNLDNVLLSGTGNPNERIEVLRSYLTRHLNTKGIGNKYSFQKQIIEKGFYTKENLALINSAAGYFSQPPILQNPQGPSDYSRSEV